MTVATVNDLTSQPRDKKVIVISWFMLRSV